MLYFYSTPKNTKNKRKENNKLTGDNKIKKKDILYYAQILPNVGIYNVCEMIVCTLYEYYFACMDKREKKRYLFNYSDIDRILFANRLEALTLVTDAEKDKPKVSNEGEGFAQGIFLPYGITVDDDCDGVRNGGFGSTTK